MIAPQIAPASSIEAVTQLKRRMTYEEFLAWADEDVHAEWKDGEVTIQMPPKNPHQTLAEFLYVLLRFFVHIRDLGLVRIAPFELKLVADGPSREPDVMFLAKDHLDRLTPERITGGCDLIVEIVSDESAHRDRVDKLDEYESIGVQEYWVIDNRPNRNRAWFYRLDSTGKFEPMPVGADGIFRSIVLPGFWLRLEWLWEDAPDDWRALAEIVGIEQIIAAYKNAARAK